VLPDVPQKHGPVTVLPAGGRTHYREEPPEGVDADVPVAAVDVFGLVVAVAPPFAGVFTD
jgi:hypothetical protein